MKDVHNIIESKEDLVYQLQEYPGKTSGSALCAGADGPKFVYETF